MNSMVFWKFLSYNTLDFFMFLFVMLQLFCLYIIVSDFMFLEFLCIPMCVYLCFYAFLMLFLCLFIFLFICLFCSSQVGLFLFYLILLFILFFREDKVGCWGRATIIGIYSMKNIFSTKMQNELKVTLCL